MAFPQDLILNLSSIGFYDFLLPFLFVFAILYGLLLKVNIFGENKRISGVLSLIISFLVASASGPSLSGFLTSIFSGASLYLAGILVIILLLAIAGFEGGYFKSGRKSMVYVAVVVILGVSLFLVSTGGAYFGITIGSDSLISTLFFVLIIVFAIWIIVGGKEETPSGGGGKPG